MPRALLIIHKAMSDTRKRRMENKCVDITRFATYAKRSRPTTRRFLRARSVEAYRVDYLRRTVIRDERSVESRVSKTDKFALSREVCRPLGPLSISLKFLAKSCERVD